jgi:hypothetical protein
MSKIDEIIEAIEKAIAENDTVYSLLGGEMTTELLANMNKEPYVLPDMKHLIENRDRAEALRQLRGWWVEMRDQS